MSSEVINLQTYYVKKADIINNLTTDDTTKPLSAKQGKALKTLIDEKAVTLTKLKTATTGYIATYEIKQGTTSLGKIDIPKDYLVKSGSVKSVTTANNPVSGYAVGDKYIDFVINTKDSSGTDEHVYINVKDLIDAYTAGTGLELSNSNQFSVKYGTAAGTACQGNDSRLSNARTPTAHATNSTTYGAGSTSNYGHVKLIENLTTNAGNGLALGAGQGKALKEQIDGIIAGTIATDHNHDGSYIKTGTGTVTSTNIADGTIVNADIASNAAIEYSKLSGVASSSHQHSGVAYADTITAGENLTQNALVFGKKNGKYYNLSSKGVLDVSYPIYKCFSAITSGGTNYTVDYLQNALVITPTKSITLTANKAVYVEGSAYSNGQFTINDAVTQTLTSGKYYIKLGTAYNTTNIRFISDMTVYRYDGTQLIPIGASYTDLANKPSTFTPSSHTHGSITNDGKIGSTANLPVITGTNGALTTGSFGTGANTFCQGNDSRLSNARTPTAHQADTNAYGAATTAKWGHTKLNSATNSTDETTAATPKAVKAAYDKGNHSHPYLSTASYSNGTLTIR